MLKESWFDHLLSRKYSTTSKKTQTSKPAAIPKTKLSIKSEFWLIVSSGGIFIILGILALGFMLFYPLGDMPLLDRIANAIAGFCSLSGFGLALSTIFEKVPLIMNNWTYNYYLNALLQLGILFGISWLYFFLISRAQKKKLEALNKERSELDRQAEGIDLEDARGHA